MKQADTNNPTTDPYLFQQVRDLIYQRQDNCIQEILLRTVSECPGEKDD